MGAAIEAALAQLDDDAPAAPPREVCAQLLEELARMIELGGFARFVREPVAPAAALPDPYRPTPFGIGVAIARLLEHGGIEVGVLVKDARPGPGVVDGQTALAFLGVRDGTASFEIVRIGTGFEAMLDYVGAAALYALDARDPYRGEAAATGGELLRRGAIATVYLGLGVLSVRAAFMTSGGRSAAKFSHVGHLGLDELAFLIAVQAIVRGDDLSLDLEGEQRDAAFAWHLALTGLDDDLRAALAIPPPDQWEDTARPPPGPLARVPIVEGGEAPAPVRPVIVRHTGAGGAIGGIVTGAALLIAGIPTLATGALTLAAAGYGAYVGRGMKRARCSACGATIADGAPICTGCGGAIEKLS